MKHLSITCEDVLLISSLFRRRRTDTKNNNKSDISTNLGDI